MKETPHVHGSTKEATSGLYAFASIDCLKLYEMAARQKTHKCYSHDQMSYAEVDLKKACMAVGTGKVKLRKVREGVDAGQQVICVQDLPADCYTIKKIGQ